MPRHAAKNNATRLPKQAAPSLEPIPRVVPVPAVADEFLAFCWANEGLAGSTRKAYSFELSRLAGYVAPAQLLEVTEVQMREFLLALHARGVQSAAARRATVACRRFYRWAVQEGRIATDPTSKLQLPKMPMPHPKALAPAQTERLVTVLVDAPERQRLRDRAMLELMYGCGLRVSELLRLKSIDLDESAGALRVVGKGDKQRWVPVGEPAMAAIQVYLRSARPQYVRASKPSQYLFLTRLGRPMSPSGFWRHLQTLAVVAGLNPELVSPHVLRHSYATDLMFGGADLRTIQMLLGHESISTTAIYLRQDKRHLREVVSAHHPRG